VNIDGSITYSTVTDEGKTNVTIDGPADSMVFSYTAYALTYYYLLCVKYNVEPFSEAAKKNTQLVSECNSCIVAGLNKDALMDSTPELIDYFPSNYVELGGSLKNFDKEKLGAAIKSASDAGKDVVLVGSGSLNASDYPAYAEIIDAQGGYGLVFSSADDTITTFAAIDQTAKIFGLEEYAEKVIEDMQLRIYKVYYSAMEKNKEKSHKAYFEGSTGKSTKASGSGAKLSAFMGWDISLFTGAEYDTETLLLEKPDVLMFYTNDDRSLDEKMRATS
jgi:ABC-type Fe3+-hydroxamate transport system substrate-binding protein